MTTLRGSLGGEPQPKRVLLVDDDPIQLKLSVLRLREAGFVVTPASSAAEALRLASSSRPDAVLSDVLMGDVDGFGLCRRLREHPELSGVPIVLASAHYWDREAQELASRLGASMLIGRTPELEAEIDALHRVMGMVQAPAQTTPAAYEDHLRTNANQISRLLGEARQAEARYRALFENANDVIAVLDPRGVILEANERWRDLLGVPPEDLVGSHLLRFAPSGRETNAALLQSAVARRGGRIHGVPMERADGTLAYVDFSLSAHEQAGELLVFAIGRDATDAFLAARALADAEHKYRSVVERLPDIVYTASEGRCRFITPNVEAITGFSQSEVYGMHLEEWQARTHPDDADRFAAARHRYLTGAAHAFAVEYRWRHKEGHFIWLLQRITARYERGGALYVDGLISDITEKKQLEERLRHAQKMEAIGLLSGGIAHDFNNILATVMANSQFLIESLDPSSSMVADAREIQLAAERAASLTRQLLAFSRRQVLELRITDLNRIVLGLEGMLRRLIGEDIELVVELGEAVGVLQVDPGQIEQALMNLAVNARDAMPQGGTLKIATGRVYLDEAAAPGEPGEYARLTVSDTGAGMTPEIQARIFEPFFTTKPVGKGTGLGLATTHGIIAQSGGAISVESEVGRGTTFALFLPTVAEPAQSASETRPSARPSAGRRELVLLIEDDAPLRTAVQRMLATEGYRVVSAADAEQATLLAAQHGSDIALLLSDVVMPQASGPEVAQQVRVQAPGAKVLFMSGYTDHAVLTNHVLNTATHFIQKPFTQRALADKVREVLDGD